MSKNRVRNHHKRYLYFLLFPIIIIIAIVIFLYQKNALNVEAYINVQKDFFYQMNFWLSQYAEVEYNLTQLGDAFIALSFLSIFVVYTPKVWESLLSALLVSVIFSFSLKELFDVPRPATIFNHDSFNIIGETLEGYSSFPSGHSITTFTVLSVLFFSFFPKKIISSFAWFLFMLFVGILIVTTRVGVGAHHPLDVTIGSLIGCVSGILGMYISSSFKIWKWIYNKKYYPLFILVFLIGFFVLIFKIINNPLIIFYLALMSLIISLYVTTKAYLQK